MAAEGGESWSGAGLAGLADRDRWGPASPGAVAPKSKLNEHGEKIIAAIQASPSLTLEELRAEKEL